MIVVDRIVIKSIVVRRSQSNNKRCMSCSARIVAEIVVSREIVTSETNAGTAREVVNDVIADDRVIGTRPSPGLMRRDPASWAIMDLIALNQAVIRFEIDTMIKRIRARQIMDMVVDDFNIVGTIGCSCAAMMPPMKYACSAGRRHARVSQFVIDDADMMVIFTCWYTTGRTHGEDALASVIGIEYKSVNDDVGLAAVKIQ